LVKNSNRKKSGSQLEKKEVLIAKGQSIKTLYGITAESKNFKMI